VKDCGVRTRRFGLSCGIRAIFDGFAALKWQLLFGLLENVRIQQYLDRKSCSSAKKL
jgi:hypothetical protein